MKFKPNPFRSFLQLQNLASSGAAMAVILLGFAANSAQAQVTTGFLQTDAGPYDYDTAANWVDGTINGNWDSSLTLTAAQAVTFDSDLALTSGLTFGYTGNVALTLRGDGTDRAITLGGDVSVAPVSNQTVILGSATAGQNLNVNLGGVSRLFSVNTSKGLTLNNVVSNGAINKAGAGTLTLSGANTFNGLTLGGGTLTLGNHAALGTGTLTINGGTTLNVNAARNTTNNNAQNWNGDFTFGGANTLNLGTGAVTMDGSRTITASASTLTVGGAIGESGSGFSLTKAGAGTMVLNGANTYSGGTFINAGVLTVGAAGNLGSNVSGNNVTINGGILNLGAASNIGANQSLTVGSSSSVLSGLGLAFNTLPAFTPSGSNSMLFAINTTAGFDAITSQSTVGTGKDFLGSTGTGIFSGPSLGAGSDGTYRLGGGGGTLTLTNGVLTGANALVVGSTLTNGGGTVVLQGSNNLSGTTVVAGGSTLKLSGANGALTSSAVNVLQNSTLNLDSGTASVTGTTRAPSVTLKSSGSLTVTGNSTANSTDTITGALTIDGSLARTSTNASIATVTVTQNAARNAQLSIGSLKRESNGVVLLRGTNLGASTILSASANNGNIKITGAAPTLVGGSGALGSTNISIIPWAIGGTSSSDIGSTFVTYTADNGVHALTTAEHATTYNSATDNVRITSATAAAMAVNSATTVNSLNISGGTGFTLAGTNTLTVTSGAILFNGNSGYTISANLDFGTAEGVVGYQRGSTISGAIAGTGGLTVYNLSTTNEILSLSNAANTYSGDTNVLGTLNLMTVGALPNGSGKGNVNVTGSLIAVTGSTFNGLNGSGVVSFGSSGGGTLTVGGNNANGSYSGTIGVNNNGSGSVVKIGGGTQTLSGLNRFKGGITINGGVLEANTLVNGGNNDNVTNPSSIGFSSSAAASVIINGGTLRYIGAATSSDRLFTVGTLGGALDASGSGAVVLSNAAANVSAEAGNRNGSRITGSNVVTNVTNFADLVVGARINSGTGIPAGTTITALNPTAGEITLSAAATSNVTNGSMSFSTDRKLTLGGSNTGDNTIGSVLANSINSGKLGVTKSGTGKWILGAFNTYKGDTDVQNGTLVLAEANELNESSTVRIAASATLTLDFDGEDYVDRLFIGGVQQPAGIYKAIGNTDTGTELAQITGTGLLVVNSGPVGGDDYAAWTTDNAGGQTPDLDFDGDGTPNGVEYFMGVTTPGFTPNPSVVAGKITWPMDPGFLGTYVVEESSDLTNWAPVEVVETVSSVEYILPTGETKVFVRLNVDPQ